MKTLTLEEVDAGLLSRVELRTPRQTFFPKSNILTLRLCFGAPLWCLNPTHKNTKIRVTTRLLKFSRRTIQHHGCNRIFQASRMGMTVYVLSFGFLLIGIARLRVWERLHDHILRGARGR